jgi:serine/threonine protein kinase
MLSGSKLFSEFDIKVIVTQLLLILDYFEITNKVVHRNLTPKNIVLGDAAIIE